MIIALYGNTYQSAHINDLRKFIRALSDNKEVKLLIDSPYRDYLKSIIGDIPEMTGLSAGDIIDADLILSIGGDGTFLHTAAHVAPNEIPIMGINSGHLGYLSASPLSLSSELVDDIIAKRYIIEDRAMLRARASRQIPIKGDSLSALNEIAILRPDQATMIEVSAKIDGKPLATYLGDGLIIATPTGSTAYNLSAGGPILAPNAPSWVLTPVAPHSLNMRPLVVSYDTEIRLKIKSRTQRYTLSVDGHSIILPTETELIIDRAPYVTRLVRLANHTFIDTLRSKLLWGISPR